MSMAATISSDSLTAAGKFRCALRPMLTDRTFVAGALTQVNSNSLSLIQIAGDLEIAASWRGI